jgi:hypothetical protein
MIDPDGVLRPLRPVLPSPRDVDNAAAEQARRLIRDAALLRAIELLRR